ncbi:hypothetical protein PX699_29695 [Sphingobium sp. H39-3-25]|uniref:hypothetical protein n=1 Tax=Sphingobium arseniciresistens TaxID=3030834 RepID=UPI0023B92926|nr:hypothetical protein [Sphingobium arseniciresistens]
MVTVEEVIWAYRLILGRDPENENVIANATTFGSTDVLIREFLSSDEYRMRRFASLGSGAKGDRLDEIRAFIDRGARGIEIGPWFNPICPKRDGYRTLVLDVFDQAELISRAQADPGIDDTMIERIEAVDIVGSVAEMDKLLASHNIAGTLDYVVSSHNFEHIPDPIRFLRACSGVLNETGVLSMAIPDRRTCFDHFRPHTATGEVLEAFWAERLKPSPAQIFSHIALHAVNNIDGVERIGWGLGSSPANVALRDTITNAYDIAQRHRANAEEPYFDAHCWTFSPSSFEAIIFDLNALGLIDLSLRQIVSYGGHEFYVHLERSVNMIDPSSVAFRERRSELLRKIIDENGTHTRTVG